MAQAYTMQLAGDPGDNGELTETLDMLTKLYECGDDRELLEHFTADMPVEAIEAYADFLRVLRDNVIDAEILWASPSDDHGTKAKMSREQLGNAILTLEDMIDEIKHEDPPMPEGGC